MLNGNNLPKSEDGNRAPVNHKAQGGPEKVIVDLKGKQKQVRESSWAEGTAGMSKSPRAGDSQDLIIQTNTDI